MKKLCVWAVAALLMAACTPKAEKATDSGLLQSKFQTEVDGKKTDLFTLRNKNNMEVCITNFGGRIVSVMVPDKDGQMRDVVLGFDSIQDYISKPSDFGATIGRYANRINQGQFTLDSVEYQLPRNNYGHCLHGGPQGFQYRVFDAELLNPQELQLTYRAEDGEDQVGGPGKRHGDIAGRLWPVRHYLHHADRERRFHNADDVHQHRGWQGRRRQQLRWHRHRDHRPYRRRHRQEDPVRRVREKPHPMGDHVHREEGP